MLAVGEELTDSYSGSKSSNTCSSMTDWCDSDLEEEELDGLPWEAQCEHWELEEPADDHILQPQLQPSSSFLTTRPTAYQQLHLNSLIPFQLCGNLLRDWSLHSGSASIVWGTGGIL